MALSAPRPQTDRLGDDVLPPLLKVPVAASVKIWAGAMVMLDAGYGKPAAAAVGKVIVGRAESTVDNTTGSAGDKVVVVRRGVFKWNNSSSGDAITQAEMGTIVYAVDDQTVAKTSNSGARSAAGVALQLESDGVLVQQGLMSQSELDAISEAQGAAVVTLTDSTGLSGSHDDTIAACSLSGTLTGTANGSLVDVAAAAGACAGGAEPSATQVDAAIATAVAPIVSGTNEQMKEIQAKLLVANQNFSDLSQKFIEVLARLVTAGIIAA